MARVTIELVIEKIDLENEDILDVLESKFPDTFWSERDGVVTVTQAVDPLEFYNDYRALAVKIIEELDARPVRWHDDFVGYAEIGRRSDMSSEGIRLWAKGLRGPGNFPSPRGFVGIAAHRSPIWRWSEVATWLREEMNIGIDSFFPDEEQIAHINAHLFWLNNSGDREIAYRPTSPAMSVDMPANANLILTNVGIHLARSAA